MAADLWSIISGQVEPFQLYQKILDPVLFHNISDQNPAAGRDQGSARESEFLLPQKHAPLPKNVNRLKSQKISAGFSKAVGVIT
jgi:hypothetical protein